MNDFAQKDAEQLRLLGVGHYVMAGLTAFFGLIPLIHVGMGLAMVSGRLPMGPPPSGSSAPFPPHLFGWLFVIVGVVVIVIAQTMAVLNVVAARSLATRRRRMFCMVVAALNCMNAPLGTLLGVFTFVVIGRDSVKLQFAANS